MLPVSLPGKQLPVLCYSWEGRIAGGKKREVDLQQIALIMVSLAYIRQFLFPLPPLFLGIPFINISWLFTTSSFMHTWAASISSTINLITSLFCLRCLDDNKQICLWGKYNLLSNADTEVYENSAFGHAGSSSFAKYFFSKFFFNHLYQKPQCLHFAFERRIIIGPESDHWLCLSLTP